jgi:curved DNA-binding protein CbpA
MTRRADLWQHYLALGLNPGASLREVKQAYRTLVKKWHPDQFHHDPRLEQLAEDKLKEINHAYAVLLNPDQSTYRRRYGRPTAGQQSARGGFAGDSQHASESWSATERPFHYQSSYYRTRQAKAAGGARRRGAYASAYAAYGGSVQNRPQVPRWAIMLVMFCAMAMVNTFTSSVLNGSSSRNYASAPAQSGTSARPQVTNFIPIVTMSEKELKEQKERESRAVAAAEKKDSHSPQQRKTQTPLDAPGK